MAISFDSARARAQARSIQNTGEELAGIATRDMPGLLAEIQASWKGEASSLFAANYSQLANQLAKEAENIRELSSRMTRVADIIEQKEKEAEQVAQTFSGGGGSAGGSSSGGGRF